ncbi:efflux RND transporter periplasmic adaptor subunit [Agaribacterium haliotis]|uniref:efflux RND transporter periplasmic adaptor subunit n=1 Tax=Agaribacterium haliotis TaxID=2013869 RepID=UPI000BB5457E|nr:efflux RND transporter periplasmic adaptor subunit [Agaribacterium haliotis]
MDKKIEKSPRRYWYWALAGLGVVVAATIVALGPGSGQSFSVKGERLSIAEVRQSLFEDYLPLRVFVQPFKTVYLDAIEGGRVEKIFVEEGELVEKGQKLLELSNTTLQLDLISREAQVSEQLNNLRNTKLAIEQNRLSLKRDLIEIDYQIKRLKRRLERRQKLADYVGEEEIDTLEDELHYMELRRTLTLESQQQEEQMRLAQIEQLETSVAQLEKNLVIARSNLDNLIVKAPRSGRLTAFDVELGETRNRGQRLGQIDDVERYKASGMVSEYYLNRLSLGQRAEVEIHGHNYELELSKIYPEVRNNEFEVDLNFVGAAPKSIRRGQSLSPRLMLSKRERVLLVDNGSFIQESGGAWVFVLSEDGQVAYKRDVKFGRRNPSQLEITQGLEAGEKIIVSSYGNYRNVDRLFIEH